MSYDSWLEPPENYQPEPVTGNCADCDGRGKIENPDYHDDCKIGAVECDQCEQEIECHHCEGTGEVEIEECDSCGHAPCSCDEQYDAWRDSRL